MTKLPRPRREPVVPPAATDGRMRGLLVAALGASVVALVPGLVYYGRNTALLTGRGPDSITDLIFPAFALPFVIIGGVVVWRRPNNAVAWGLFGIGAAFLVGIASGAYAGWSMLAGEPNALAHTATVVGRALFITPLILVPLIVVRLPSGEIVTRHGRWLSRFAIGVGVLLVAWWVAGSDSVAIPAEAEGPELPKLHSPLDLFDLSAETASAVSAALAVPLIASWLLAGFGLVRRVRRGSLETRAQGRWILLGALALPAGFLAAAIVDALDPGETDWPWAVAFTIGVLAAPLAIGVAVTRYRLYEIDRIVSRTVSYALVVAASIGAYAVMVIAPTALLGSGDVPPWLVAGATLAVAALFRPLQSRVQRMVDRRFNRSRYDAVAVVEGVGSRVRASTDVSSIASELSGAVGRIMQPAFVGLWLR